MPKTNTLPSLQNLAKSTSKLIALMLLFWLSTKYAFAQEQNAGLEGFLSSVKDTDLSANILKKIFSDEFVDEIGKIGAVTGGSVMAAMFEKFNSGLLAVAIFYFGYQSTAAIAQTAEGGAFMGRRFSTVWVPIRFIVGVGSLVPVFSGYCGAQVIFMWFAKIAIGIANTMVLAGLTVIGNAPDYIAGKAAGTEQNATAAAFALATGHICKISAENAESAALEALPELTAGGVAKGRVYRILPSPTNLPSTTTAAAGVGSDTKGIGNFYIGFGTPGQLNNKLEFGCGGARLSVAPKNVLDTEATPDEELAFDAKLAGYRLKAFEISKKNMLILEKEMEDLAKTFVDKYENNSVPTDFNFNGRVNFAAKKYIETTKKEVRDAFPENARNEAAYGEATKMIEKYGWVMLGSFYQTIATSATAFEQAINIKLEPIEAEGNVINFADETARIVSAAKKSELTHEKAKGQTSIFDALTKPLEYLAYVAGQDAINGGADFILKTEGTVNPILALKDFGDQIVVGTEVALFAYAGFASGEREKDAGESNSTGFFGRIWNYGKQVFASTVQALSPVLMTLIVALFIFGMTLAVYIPMLPFITWYGGIIGWFGSVIEALVAAPIGAFAHLDADGEGMGQRTQHTYLFLLNTLLRPALMVFGFFAATFGVVILGKLLIFLFAPALKNAQTDSITGIVMIIGYLAVFTSLALTMIHGCFNLIHLIPDQVIGWAGGGISTRMGQDTTDKTFVGFGQTGQKIEGGAATAIRSNVAGRNDGGGPQGR